MCPTHHAVIDETEPDRFPVEKLLEMKARHESHVESFRHWATEIDLEIYADLGLAEMRTLWRTQDEEAENPGLPEISFRRRPGGDLRALNRGPGSAVLKSAKVMIGSDSSVAFYDLAERVLEEDQSEVVGRFDPSGLEDGETVIRLTWSDQAGAKFRSKNLHIVRSDYS
jgi:hypothetical protein